jgi:hypothetical protein
MGCSEEYGDFGEIAICLYEKSGRCLFMSGIRNIGPADFS